MAGFTLIEVLVALTLMAVLAGLAWRGIDTLVKTRDGAQAATDHTLRLSTAMSQFEYDLSMLTDTGGITPLACDGATLRMTRRQDGGVQLVAWSLQDKAWQRWASAPTTRLADLQEAWLRSQQWASLQGSAVQVLPGLSAWQVYFYRNGWSNCSSSGDTVQLPVAGAGGASGAGGAGGTDANGGGKTPGAGSPPPAKPDNPTPATDGGGTNGPTPPTNPDGSTPPATQRTRTITIAPTGVRILLTLPEGDITRQVLLPPGGAGVVAP